MLLAFPLPARGDEILDQVRPVFSEKGFDGASMQDLARATKMSVGNFYRYFPSKAAIVEAMIARDLTRMQEDFRRILQAQDPMLALKAVIAARMEMHRVNCDGRLWTEIDAFAQRNPEVARSVAVLQEAIITCLCDIFAKVSGNRGPKPDQAHAEIAALVVLLFRASTQISPHSPERADHLIARVHRIIENVLSEIALPTEKE